MAALVQSYPQQAVPGAMMSSRSSSASGLLAGHQMPNQGHGQGSNIRNNFQGHSAQPAGGYRGSSGPIPPYAYTATPSLNPNAVAWQPGAAYRASSTPTVPTMQSFEHGYSLSRGPYPASSPMAGAPSNVYGLSSHGSRDDSAIPGTARRVPIAPRPQSSHMMGSYAQVLQHGMPAKNTPDRYRRPVVRNVDTSSTSPQPLQSQQSTRLPTSTTGAMDYTNLVHSQSDLRTAGQRLPPSSTSRRPTNQYSATLGASADDIQLYRRTDTDVKRLRRRSMPTLDNADIPIPVSAIHFAGEQDAIKPEQTGSLRPADKKETPSSTTGNKVAEGTIHSRTGSSDSAASIRSSNSRPSSAKRHAKPTTPTGTPASLSSLPPAERSPSQDYPRLVNIPPRSSSSDAANSKRSHTSSPLARPMAMDSEANEGSKPTAPNGSSDARPVEQSSGSTTIQGESPAVKQLAAIREKGGRLKSKTSRLRRALSFGSAADFKDAAGADSSPVGQSAGPAKLHKEPTSDELYDAEQARIAQKQEAGGIGNSIYSGGKIFSGSTDNLSISSTASSASIMIRKMGNGMKKGTRSLVGLFRPKSRMGVSDLDDAQPGASPAAVSMVTVEAERERVNVNADPHQQSGGGTGFPRLERNSVDAAAKAPSAGSDRLGSSGTDESAPRRSIIGGEPERAEVLAAVRKGILKKDSRSSSPAQDDTPAFDLPNVPAITDSPNSSAPSTPVDEPQGHKRTGSIAVGHEDYFMAALRLRQDTKSAPGTPRGAIKRSATFSPRIIFHDTWPSQEYDRRGETATANRLTPMLAQQIKEELNTFKMEMEVHENSKIYTHFF